MAVRMPPVKSWEYTKGLPVYLGFKPWCYFCGREDAVYEAVVIDPQRKHYFDKDVWFSCALCVGQLHEVSAKSLIKEFYPSSRYDHLWYEMKPEQVRKHPEYLKWQGC